MLRRPRAEERTAGWGSRVRFDSRMRRSCSRRDPHPRTHTPTQLHRDTLSRMSTVSYGRLVRENRDFRLYWGGQIVSQLGDWFSSITVQALLLKYTGSTASLGGFMVATMLPGLLLG